MWHFVASYLICYYIIMRYYTTLSLIVLTLLLTWCSLTTKTDLEWDYDTIILDSGSDAVQEPLGNIEWWPGNIYTFFFDWDKTQTVDMYHVAGEPTKIYFINSRGKSMNVSVSYINEVWNIRLSQIIMPDGEMDWPFGTELEYPLDQFGGYELIFNENMMAWDPWSGDIKITVSLE